jgi:hypothetical protein
VPSEVPTERRKAEVRVAFDFPPANSLRSHFSSPFHVFYSFGTLLALDFPHFYAKLELALAQIFSRSQTGTYFGIQPNKNDNFFFGTFCGKRDTKIVRGDD